MATVAPERKVARPAFYRQPGFFRFLLGLGSAVLGSQLWLVALGWTAGQLANPLHTSLIMAAGTVPRAVLLLIGGTVVDRFGAAKIATASQLASVGLMAGAIPLLLVTRAHPGALLAIALVFGIIDALFLPAASSLPPLLLPAADLPAAQGFLQTLERLLLLVGAPVGGYLASAGGIALACTANLLLFVVAAFAFRAMPLSTAAAATAHGQPENTWQSLRSGLRYVRTTPAIWLILLVVTTLNLGLSGAVNVGLVLVARHHHWSANGYAWALAAFGLGASLGALSLLRIRPRRRPAQVGLLWVIAGAICTGALAFASSLLAAIGVLAALGVTMGPASALLLGLVQANAAPAYLGRVMSLMTFSGVGLVPLSFAGFGLLVSVAGLPAAFLLVAAATLLTAGIALALPAIRRVGPVSAGDRTT